ncbi:GYD domain-containing protein [Oxalobacteraceae bacterium OM1]|nr:GYD domain-containing protein [Oxalobacteraceae bacterium OM1]
MATYVTLVNFTDQGIRNVKDTTNRLTAFRGMAEGLGVSLKSAYYTVGQFDMVITLEGSDEAITTAMLKVSSLGNVRSQTLRAFSADEMKAMLAKMPS